MNSPYYFVPFAEDSKEASQVFLPENPDLVSHDFPHQDGFCGHLEIELETTTPLYIRNAGDHRDYRDSGAFAQDLQDIRKTNQGGKSVPKNAYAKKDQFCDYVRHYHIRNTPAIPGTSLKGPIRTILQILTKARCEPVNERRYSMRDLDSQDYKSWFKGDVHAGFVCWNPIECRYDLMPCEHAKIEQVELEKLAESKNKKIYLGRRQSAQEKYEKWFSEGLPDQLTVHVRGHEAFRAQRENTTPKKGILVFVGQITERDGNRNAKKREYVFTDYEKSTPVPISDEIWQGFLDAHEDTNRRPTASWQYWKDKLQKNPSLRVPVFYLAHLPGEAGTDRSKSLAKHPEAVLHSFGLSRLYRLPYRLAMHGAIPVDHRPPISAEDARADPGFDGHPEFPPDFPSLLMGEARPQRHLKGRVSFGPLLLKKSQGQCSLVFAVLGGPKPGFYPNYMNQGKTLMQPDARFRGWKFYPARKDGKNASHTSLPTDDDSSLKVCTAFEPLAAGTTFRGKVRFHNLRPHELGALIWALTWGGRAECRHRLGMGKPLGYGCAKISILSGEAVPNSIADESSPNQTTSLEAGTIRGFAGDFEQWISKCRGMAGWLESASMRSLLAMAREDHGVSDSQLNYPVLDPKQNRNDFKDAKKSRSLLHDWFDVPRIIPPSDFTFWPGWMLPQKKVQIDEKVFPGGHLASSARRDTSLMEERQIYLCRVISKNLNRRKIRLQVVGGDDQTQGELNLTGDSARHFDVLSENQEIVVCFKAGGPRNRIFTPCVD